MRKSAAPIAIDGRSDERHVAVTKLHHASSPSDGPSEEPARLQQAGPSSDALETAFLASFAVRLESWRLGSLDILSLEAAARRSTRTREQIARDRYDPIGVQYVVSGNATGLAGQRYVESVPGTILLLDYLQPFSIRDEGPRQVIDIAVPRGQFPAPARNAADCHGKVLTNAASRVLGDFMASLVRRLPELTAADAAPLSTAFLTLLAASLEARGQGTHDPYARLIRHAQAMVDGAVARRDLGPAWLATELGVSRSELYDALERFGGVARFILQRRLDGAWAALHDPRDTRRIKEIAFAFGFGSEAHFARAFRATFGTTASHARKKNGG